MKPDLLDMTVRGTACYRPERGERGGGSSGRTRVRLRPPRLRPPLSTRTLRNAGLRLPCGTTTDRMSQYAEGNAA